jgi:hypothetical protein
MARRRPIETLSGDGFGVEAFNPVETGNFTPG